MRIRDHLHYSVYSLSVLWVVHFPSPSSSSYFQTLINGEGATGVLDCSKCHSDAFFDYFTKINYYRVGSEGVGVVWSHLPAATASLKKVALINFFPTVGTILSQPIFNIII